MVDRKKSDSLVFDINNRRYTGSKYKLTPWIKSILLENCPEHKSFFDVFGGTGIVSVALMDVVSRIFINDFLYSNEIIYKAFFDQANFDLQKLLSYVDDMGKIKAQELPNNYVSDNYGNKFFTISDAKLIGFIREDIERRYKTHDLSEHEYTILLASLLYSLDRCANTVGHYEAYIKGKDIRSSFMLELIRPIKTNAEILIFRQDSNELSRNIRADIAFVDPPYNSRQYSRFYHVLETIVKWDKPVLSGVAMKPPEENMSGYCRKIAPIVFDDLIMNLDTKHIAVTYNNTYDSKSSSSLNKITLEEIEAILTKRGSTKMFFRNYHRFNAGKTDKAEHKEILFITEVNDE